MTPEITAEVTLSPDSPIGEPASPVTSFGFILTFGDQSFSAAVLPSGSHSLRPDVSERVRLRFLVEAAGRVAGVGKQFTFREGRRIGRGQILEVHDA